MTYDKPNGMLRTYIRNFPCLVCFSDVFLLTDRITKESLKHEQKWNCTIVCKCRSISTGIMMININAYNEVEDKRKRRT